MEKIIKKPSELIIGETYNFFWKKKPKDEPYDFIEGVVDFINKTKVRLIGFYKSNRIMKLIDFENFEKVVRPGYDILLPKEILEKSKLNEKDNFSSLQLKKESKVKIKDVEKLLNQNKKVRYYYPEPISQKHLYIDCIVKEVKQDSYKFQSLDTTDGRVVKLIIPKNSNALIHFLNKNVKLLVEIRQDGNRITKDDFDLLEEGKKKGLLYNEHRNIFHSNEKQTKKKVSKNKVEIKKKKNSKKSMEE